MVWSGKNTKLGDIHREQLLDRTGRYLFLFASQQKKPDSYEVIDLHQRQSIAHYVAKANIATALTARSVIDSNGILPFISPKYVRVTQPRVRMDFVGYELAYWNLLTNEVKTIKSFSKQSTFRFSNDDSTLLEVEHITPFPSMLYPNNLVSSLGNLAAMHLHSNDLSIMRFWSLPESKVRCTMAMPWLPRQGRAFLSYDGKYLILPDAYLPWGFESKEPLRSPNVWTRTTITNRYFIALPKGIKVYDTQTGRLCTERTGYDDGYVEVTSSHPDAIAFQSTLFTSAQARGCLLHLPTMQWHDNFHNHLNTMDAEHVQLIEHPSTEMASKIISIDQSGNRRLLANVPMYIDGLLPEFHQYYFYTGHRFVDSLPAWLNDWLQKQGILPAWMLSYKTTMQVVDYLTHQTVFTLTVGTPMQAITDSNHWLVVSHYAGDSYHVAVYDLPFASWSPWWALTAGMLVVVLCWYALRCRKTKSTA